LNKVLPVSFPQIAQQPITRSIPIHTQAVKRILTQKPYRTEETVQLK